MQNFGARKLFENARFFICYLRIKGPQIKLKCYLVDAVPKVYYELFRFRIVGKIFLIEYITRDGSLYIEFFFVIKKRFINYN